LGKVVRVADPQISPDGKSIALVVSRANYDENRYDPQLVLLDEVHPDPDHALSDGAQSLFPDQFEDMMRQLRMIAPAVGRTV